MRCGITSRNFPDMRPARHVWFINNDSRNPTMARSSGRRDDRHVHGLAAVAGAPTPQARLRQVLRLPEIHGTGIVPPRIAATSVEKNPMRISPQSDGQSKWACTDLNRGPRDYESPALTAELQARKIIAAGIIAVARGQCKRGNLQLGIKQTTGA